MKFKPAAVSAAVVATLALAACGGGGNDSGGGFFLPPVDTTTPPPAPAPPPPPPPPPAPPAPAPAPAPTPAATTFLYESLAPSADKAAFLAKLNAQGARGFRFLSGFAFGGTGAVETYVRDVDATYGYELQGISASNTDFLTQANGAGARGFRWVGFYAVGGETFNMYRKDGSSSATYSYRIDSAGLSKAGYLAQANAQGASGYFNVAPTAIVGSAAASVYEKSSVGGTFAYELAPRTSSNADFMAQLDAEGARGFRFRTELVFSDGQATIYARDTSQSASYAFYGLAPAATAAAFTAQANAEGAKGAGLIGGFVLPEGTVATLYYKPTACAGGPLCLPVSLFGF